MQFTIQPRIHLWLLALLLMLMAGQLFGATRVLDRIEIRTEKGANVISVHFNVPVRYVSHLVNEANSEVGIQIKVGQTSDTQLGQAAGQADGEWLEEDQLTWSPTEPVPLAKVVFQGNRIGTSTLLISFASAVKDFKIRQGRDFYVMDFILPEKPPGRLPGLSKIDSATELPTSESRAPLSVKSLPLVIYVINLSVKTEPVDFSKIAPVPVGENQLIYTTKMQLEETARYQLRLGFFRTKEEAREQLKAVKGFYPDAWIDTADIAERRKAFFDRDLEPLFDGQMMKEPVLVDVDPRLTGMMEMIRRTITVGDYAKAVRLLEALLEEPDNIYSKEALELLGLSRERNGQIAHAKGEYRLYLEKYPLGEDAERVWQRLLGLETAPQSPKEPRRKQQGKPGEPGSEEEEDKAIWDTYGSFSQSYRRDTIDSPFVEDEDSVSRSEIENFVDFNARRRSANYDIRMKLTGSLVYDLLPEGDNDSTISDAYLDVEHLESRTNARFGRQRLRSSGILNRFDGLVLGYELTPDIKIRATAGLPVERSRDTFLNKHKQFAGISGDVASIIENWDLSLFLVEQRVDGLVDRRALGGEIRYFDEDKSFFSLIDYDIFHSELGILMLQGNWRFADMTTLYMNLDYRNSPILSTSNALSGQNDPDTLMPLESIEVMQNYYTDNEIYELAKDRSAKTTTASLGVSYPYTETLQLSGDITVSKTGETTASGGVLGTEATDTEFFYTFQLIKNDLLKQGDIGVFSLRYSDSDTSNTYRLGVSNRYPITNAWRINPRLDFSSRQNKDNDGSRLTISPFLRSDYRFRKNLTFEVEGGLNWFEEDDGVEVTNFTDYFFYAGYRWDFR
ncbi:MAG: tetratricopeptide repeat protein [Candidatus Thiodiazotropha sp.]